MRVAIVSQGMDFVLPPEQTSVGVCTYGLARHLAASHEVIAFMSAKGDAPPDSVVDGARFRSIPSSRIDRLAARAYPRVSRLLGRLPGHRLEKPFSASLWCSPIYTWRVARGLRRERPDVIHIQQAVQFAPVCRILNPKSIIVAHRHALWDDAAGRSATLRYLRSVHVNTCVSGYIADDFRNAFPDFPGLVDTIYNGVEEDQEETDPTGEHRSKTVLFAGHLSPHKGVHNAILAFADVAANHPDFSLEIVGPPGAYALNEVVVRGDTESRDLLLPFYTEDGRWLSKHEATVRYTNFLHSCVPATLADRVRFVGHLPHDEVRRRMREATIFIFPSLYREGFGMPPVEAMACGTPVVATRAGAVSETVTDGVTGYLVDRGDVGALADRLDRLLSDEGLRARMGTAAREDAIRRFSWTAVARQAERIYEQAVAEGPRLGRRSRLAAPRRPAVSPELADPGHLGESPSQEQESTSHSNPEVPDRATGRLDFPNRFARSVFATYGATLVTGLSTLLVTPLLLHYLGTSDYAVWALAVVLTGYVNLSDLGISNATTKLVAEQAAANPDQITNAVSTNFFALCALSIVAIIAGLGLSIAAPHFLILPRGVRSDAVITIAILAASVGLTLPVGAYYGVLSGLQRYDLIAVCNSVGGFLRVVATVLVLLAGGGLIDLALTVSAVGVVSTLLPAVLVHRIVPGLHVRLRHAERARLRRTISLSIGYMAQSLSAVIGLDIDLLVVGVLIGVKGVALYSVGATFGLVADKAVGPLQQVFFPHASAVSVGPDATSRLRGVLIDGTRMVLALAMPVSLFLIFLASPAIHAWVGPGYGVSAQVVVVIGFTTIFSSMNSAAWQLIAGLGRVRLAALISIADALVNLVVSISLAKLLGPVGVALGTLVGVIVVNLPLIISFTVRIVDVSVLTLVRRALVPHLVPTLVTAALLAGAYVVIPGAILPVVLAAAGAFLVYQGVYLRWGALPEERAQLSLMLSNTWKVVLRRTS